MNYPQRAVLRIVGVLLFLFALIFNIFLMPQAGHTIIADEICNARIDIAGNDLEVGQFSQNVLDYGNDCRKVHWIRLGLDYSWVVMAGGVVLFSIGVWAGLGAKGKKEILG